MKVSVFWFRRDLRLEDNTGLDMALASDLPVIPLFVFDKEIIDELPADDARITFIHDVLREIDVRLKEHGSSVLVLHDKPLKAWEKVLTDFEVEKVFWNKDYEPYAIKRDSEVKKLLKGRGVSVLEFKDQVIFEENEVLKKDGDPYTIFTPFKNQWLKQFTEKAVKPAKGKGFENYHRRKFDFPSLKKLGFERSGIEVRDFDLSGLDNYADTRDIPALDATSYLGPHLRFGTISIREVIRQLKPRHEVFLSELVWREFFMQILFHFPDVVDHNFREKYDGVVWRNEEKEFEKWCKGETGYPLVDAGMRQLNQTGYMHNRVRMVTAGFLCKHLLVDWRWGEAYFAEKLLDYELSSNNGNWQWAAGTGCDAAPYFRIFNPESQLKKFDKDLEYVKKWIPGFDQEKYLKPLVEHSFARERALKAFKRGIKK